MRYLLKIAVISLIYFTNISYATEINFPDMDDSSATLLETKKETLIGDMIMQKIHGSDFLVADPVVNEYLHGIAAHFTTQPNMRHIRLDIFGVNTPEFNAFAFFGGHIAVHSGLMLAVDNESELVAVLAHETAHITQRHLSRIMTANQKMMPLTVAELLAAVAIGAMGAPDAGIHLATAAMAGHMQSMINFTREHEQEADRIGIKMLAQTQFDPNAMATVFQRMKQRSQYQVAPPEYLLTHPVFDSRIADAQNRASLLARRQASDSLFFHLIRARLEAGLEESTSKKISRLKEKLDSGHYQNKTAAQYAYALALLNNPKQANAGISLLQTLATENPNQWPIELSLAEAEARSGQQSSALQRTQRLLEIYPENYAIALQHVHFLLQTKQPSSAITLLTTYRKAHFNDPQIHQLLTHAYSLSGQQTEIHRSQAEWHFARGEFKDAFKQLEIALEYVNSNKMLLDKIEQRKKTMQATIDQQQSVKL